jgi:hypothetical protein
VDVSLVPLEGHQTHIHGRVNRELRARLAEAERRVRELEGTADADGATNE